MTQYIVVAIPAAHTRVVVTKDARWDESKHPRAEDGKFGSGGGGSAHDQSASTNHGGAGDEKGHEAHVNHPDGPGGKPKNAGAKIEHATSAEDFPRFLSEIESTPEHKEVTARMKKLADTLPQGKNYMEWSKHEHTKPNGKYKAERAELHDKIIAGMLPDDTKAAPGEKPKLVMLLGPPGAGKTVAGKPYAEKFGKLANINSDDVKSALPEYAGWNAGAFHEESSDVVEQKALPKAAAGNHNILLDGTGANGKKMNEMASQFHKLGYDVHVINVSIPAYKSAGRAWERFQKNAFQWNDATGEPGRFVPPDHAFGYGDKPLRTYNALKENPAVQSWVSIDNDVPFGEKPKTVDEGKR